MRIPTEAEMQAQIDSLPPDLKSAMEATREEIKKGGFAQSTQVLAVTTATLMVGLPKGEVNDDVVADILGNCFDLLVKTGRYEVLEQVLPVATKLNTKFALTVLARISTLHNLISTQVNQTQNLLDGLEKKDA